MGLPPSFLTTTGSDCEVLLTKTWEAIRRGPSIWVGKIVVAKT